MAATPRPMSPCSMFAGRCSPPSADRVRHLTMLGLEGSLQLVDALIGSACDDAGIRSGSTERPADRRIRGVVHGRRRSARRGTRPAPGDRPARPHAAQLCRQRHVRHPARGRRRGLGRRRGRRRRASTASAARPMVAELGSLRSETSPAIGAAVPTSAWRRSASPCEPRMVVAVRRDCAATSPITSNDGVPPMWQSPFIRISSTRSVCANLPRSSSRRLRLTTTRRSRSSTVRPTRSSRSSSPRSDGSASPDSTCPSCSAAAS